VKEFSKSVNIWWRYELEYIASTFYWLTVYSQICKFLSFLCTDPLAGFSGEGKERKRGKRKGGEEEKGLQYFGYAQANGLKLLKHNTYMTCEWRCYRNLLNIRRQEKGSVRQQVHRKRASSISFDERSCWFSGMFFVCLIVSKRRECCSILCVRRRAKRWTDMLQHYSGLIWA